MEEYRSLALGNPSRRAHSTAPAIDPDRPGFLVELRYAVRHPLRTSSVAIFMEMIALSVGVGLSLRAIAERTFFMGSGSGALVASVVGPAFAVVIASRGLRAQGVGLERVFVGLASATSGLWLYEILYHYGWGGTFSAIESNLFTISVVAGTGMYFPLTWALAIVVLPAVAYRRMRVNLVFITLSLATIVGFWAWINAGYPQFTWTGPGQVQGAWYNTATKMFVCLLPASLFLPYGRVGFLRAAPLEEEGYGSSPAPPDSSAGPSSSDRVRADRERDPTGPSAASARGDADPGVERTGARPTTSPRYAGPSDQPP